LHPWLTSEISDGNQITIGHSTPDNEVNLHNGSFKSEWKGFTSKQCKKVI